MNTVHSLCGRARVECDVRDLARPWCAVFAESGTVVRYATQRDAMRMLEMREFRFPTTTIRTRYRAYVARRRTYGFSVATFREWLRWQK